MNPMAIGKRLAAMVIAGATALACGTVSFGDVPNDSGKDWPQFRGPTRDNISKETGLLQKWPQGGPPLAWKATGIGDGHSSVAISGGKIFTTGREGNAVYAFALNEADGKELWKTKFGGLGNNNEGQGGKGSRSTPTVDGDMVYVEGPVGEVYCLSAADGKEVWHTNLKSNYGGIVPMWGYSDSPVVEGDVVICVPGGKGGTVLGLDKKTGKEVWRTKGLSDPAHYVSPVIAEIGGVRQAIVMTAAHLAGISPKDGTVLWMTERKGATAVIPTPVVKDNYIFVTSGYGVGCNLFKVDAQDGKFSVSKVYANKNMTNHHGGVVLVDGNLYGYSDGKGWVCMDFMTGEIKWKEKEQLGKGTVSYADGRLYLREERQGTLALLDASPEGYKEEGRFDQPDRSGKPAWPHLVIANGKLYVRDMNTLLCYDIKAK
jgi:outer membrane protein assembly factor BamB